MKRVFLYILTVFTLLSCQKSENQFLLTGEFKHLEQGEFYLYSQQGTEQIDTTRLQQGTFSKEVSINGSGIFYLLYPNYTEQVIFAQAGDRIKIKGDARKLNETEIQGNKENELMTAYRLENLKKGPKECRDATEMFIRNNSQSQVSIFLFEQLFLENSDNISPEKIKELYQIILQSHPENLHVKALQGEISDIINNMPGKKLPNLHLDTFRGDTLLLENIKDKYILLSFWASWHNSGHIIYKMRQLNKKYGQELHLISYALDISPEILKSRVKRDSITWDLYCDYKGWNNQTLQDLNIKDIPYFILADKEHKILRRSYNLEKDIIPELEKRIDKIKP